MLTPLYESKALGSGILMPLPVCGKCTRGGMRKKGRGSTSRRSTSSRGLLPGRPGQLPPRVPALGYVAADLLPGGPVNGAVVVNELELHLAMASSLSKIPVYRSALNGLVFEVHV